MNVVCATDANFVQHCTIMLTSLLINNTDVNIFLLTEGLKPQNELIIKQQVEKLKGALEIYLVDTIYKMKPWTDSRKITYRVFGILST